MTIASLSSDQLLQKEWSFFEKIYCISVAERNDRRLSAQSQFERAGLADRVEFVIVEKHPTNSELGIFEAHQKCIRLAVEKKAETTLIFEDDVLLEGVSPRVLGNAVRFMKTDVNWHLFFLGCFITKSERTRFPSVHKVHYQCTTHAYALRASFAEKLLKLSWRGVAYDDVLRGLKDDQTYAVYPPIAFQSNSPTDNDKLEFLSRTRDTFGGMRLFQKLNQFFYWHLRAIIVIHILVILIVLGLLFLKWG